MKLTALLLVCVILISCLTLTASATEELGFTVKVNPSAAIPGSQVTVIVSLANYTENVAPIRGLQVDITGVDPEVLSVVSYESLIEDEGAFSNTASYNAANRRVRLVYMQLTDTLPAPHEDVLKVVFQVNALLPEDSSLVLPVTVKVQTTAGQLTLKSECVISGSDDAEPEQSIDITWGDLTYTYTDPVWNPASHSYEGGGWSDNGTGNFTVSNTGNIRTTVEFLYQTERTDISGSFVNVNDKAVEKADLNPGQAETIYLVLRGKPSEDLNHTVIGTVTVRIGGE
jgi:hypothetical protein